MFVFICSGEDSEVELKDVKGNKFSKYSLFETACTHLCEISLAKRQSLDKLNDEFIHKKMLWGKCVFYSSQYQIFLLCSVIGCEGKIQDKS